MKMYFQLKLSIRSLSAQLPGFNETMPFTVHTKTFALILRMHLTNSQYPV